MPRTSPISCDSVFTYRYPRTRRRSGDQRSQLRRTADACSWPCRCGQPCPCVSHCPSFRASSVVVGDFVLDNVRADGRLEDIGQRVGVLAGSTIGANDRDGRARHLVSCVVSMCGADASNRRLVVAASKVRIDFASELRGLWGRARLGVSRRR